jgi:hypothetical protein
MEERKNVAGLYLQEGGMWWANEGGANCRQSQQSCDKCCGARRMVNFVRCSRGVVFKEKGVCKEIF